MRFLLFRLSSFHGWDVSKAVDDALALPSSQADVKERSGCITKLLDASFSFEHSPYSFRGAVFDRRGYDTASGVSHPSGRVSDLGSVPSDAAVSEQTCMLWEERTGLFIGEFRNRGVRAGGAIAYLRRLGFLPPELKLAPVPIANQDSFLQRLRRGKVRNFKSILPVDFADDYDYANESDTTKWLGTLHRNDFDLLEISMKVKRKGVPVSPPVALYRALLGAFGALSGFRTRATQVLPDGSTEILDSIGVSYFIEVDQASVTMTDGRRPVPDSLLPAMTRSLLHWLELHPSA